MTWVKLDDRFPTHPKVVGLSDRAFRLHVSAICYCAEHLTDGHVPVGFVSNVRDAEPLAAAGLWDPEPGGWMVHDYLAYNPTKQEASERRSKRQAAGRAGGLAKARRSLGRGHDHVPSKDVAEGYPVPVPVPVPQNAESDSASPSVEKPVGSHIPDRWPYFLERLHTLTGGESPWKALTIGGCVKIAQETSLDAVTTALSFASVDPPALTGSAYGWLQATAKSLNEPVGA